MTGARQRVTALGLLLGIAAGLWLLIHFRGLRESEPRIDPDEALLHSRIEGLRRLLARGANAPLVPFDEVLVIVQQRVVEAAVRAVLPWEGDVAGRYRIRLERATVSFDDGLALLRLEGRAALTGALADAAFAEVSLDGSLDVVDVDPGSGTLRSHVRLIDFAARRLDVVGKDAPGRDLVEDLGREQLSALADLLSTITIPVRVESDLQLPALGPGILNVPARRLPVSAGVRAVTSLRGKLLVSLSVRLGSAPATRQEEPSRGGAPIPAPVSEATMTELHAEHERLRARLAPRVENDPILALPETELGDIVIAARTTVLAEATAEAITAYFDRFELDLDNKVEVHKSGKTSVKVLLARIPAGTWTVDLSFPSLHGILRADCPAIEPRAGVLEVAAPVSLVSGDGQVSATVTWDATALASVVCGDFKRHLVLDGLARKATYQLTGRLSLEDKDGDLVAQSEIDSQVIVLHVDVPDIAWQQVRDLVRSQSEVDRCGMVLDEAGIERKLRAFIEPGFKVRLPRNLNPAIRLPTQFAPELEVFGRNVRVTVAASRPVLAMDALWSGGAVTIDAPGDKANPTLPSSQGSQP